MESKAEQMHIIHSMYWKEMNLLKANMDKLIVESERCQKFLDEFASSDAGLPNSLIFFDRYMSHMFSALNMARKFNIHLEINNLGKTILNASLNGLFNDSKCAQTPLINYAIEWRNILSQKEDETSAYFGRTQTIEHFYKTNDIHEYCFEKSKLNYLEPGKKEQTPIDRKNDIVSKNLNNLLEMLLPTKNINEFESGFVFDARIVHIRDYKKLEFFVCLSDDHKTLCHLSLNTSFKPLPCKNLPLDDVFCVLENDGNENEYLSRALIVPDEGNSQSKKLIYFIDFGEIIPLTENCKTYIAPLQYRQIPPLAIKCKLEGIEDISSHCIKDQAECEQALQKNEYKKTLFRVNYKKDRVLHVVMLKEPKDGKGFTTKSYATKNPFLISKIYGDSDQNSSASSDLLQLRSSIFSNKCMTKDPAISAEIGDRIEVLVTHVVSPISFYGIIQNEVCKNSKIFSWNDYQIFPSREKILTPKLNDVVLSKYAKDGFWYRAKVIGVNLEDNRYQVFYVDFGNTEVVPLNSLTKCAEEQLKDPFRAVLFHMANLSLISDQQSVHFLNKLNIKSAIENLVVMTLDQIINVEVVGRRNDGLVVNLIDEQFAEISKKLIDMEVVERV